MGLSASQIRLLSLTSRLSNLEFSAQQKSNIKQRLSVQSEGVSTQYTNALNQKDIKFTPAGGSNSVDLTAKVLAGCGLDDSIDSQRLLVDSTGRVLVSNTDATNFKNANGNLNTFLSNYDNAAQTTKTVYPSGVSASDYQNAQDAVATAQATYNSATAATSADTTALSSYKTAHPTATTTHSKTYAATNTSVSDAQAKVDSLTAEVDTLAKTTQADQKDYDDYVESHPNSTTVKPRPQADNRYDRENNVPQYMIDDEGMDYDVQLVKLTAKLNLDSNNLLAKEKELTAAQSVLSAAQATANGSANTPDTYDQTLVDLTNKVASDNSSVASASTGLSTAKTNLTKLGVSETTVNNTNTQYYTNLFNSMQSGYITADDKNLASADWLSQQLNSGNLYIEKYNAKKSNNDGTTGGFDSIDWSTGDNSITQTDDDDTKVAKAKAQYDSDMAKINSKDKQLDLDMKNIDTEHSAIQTEYDSVKKVIDKNIERSFKTFNG